MYSPSRPESVLTYIVLTSSLFNNSFIVLNCFCTFGIISYFHSFGINGSVSNLQNSKYPSFLVVFIFNAFAICIATDGFSVISIFLSIELSLLLFNYIVFGSKLQCLKCDLLVLFFHSNKKTHQSIIKLLIGGFVAS